MLNAATYFERRFAEALKTVEEGFLPLLEEVVEKYPPATAIAHAIALATLGILAVNISTSIIVIPIIMPAVATALKIGISAMTAYCIFKALDKYVKEHPLGGSHS